MSNDTEYKVGFGKPPKSGQFKAGKSGNPNGRPKKERDHIHDMIDDIFFTKREIPVNGKKVSLNAIQIALMKLNEASSKGNQQAIRQMFELLCKYGFSDTKLEFIPPSLPSRAELAKMDTEYQAMLKEEAENSSGD